MLKKFFRFLLLDSEITNTLGVVLVGSILVLILCLCFETTTKTEENKKIIGIYSLTIK